MQRTWNVFPLYNVFSYISHVYKNHQMTQTKLINYLKGYHIIAIYENTSKYEISDSKEDNYRGVPLQQIWML